MLSARPDLLIMNKLRALRRCYTVAMGTALTSYTPGANQGDKVKSTTRSGSHTWLPITSIECR